MNKRRQSNVTRDDLLSVNDLAEAQKKIQTF
jgi:hypothetical protein